MAANKREADDPARMLSALVLLVATVLCGCDGSRVPSDDGDGPPAAHFAIPEPSEWKDAGEAIAAGPTGAWDARLSGALSPATIVRTGDTYLLYYIGADGDRVTPPGDDGGPRHRALGVATSQDGIRFTKYGGNPVIRFRPTPDGSNAQEEGVFSAAAESFDAGVNLYFGGMTMTGDTGVRIDIFQATSADGFTFEPPQKVLDAEAPGVWGNDGAGNEILPGGSFRHKATWHLYYLTKNRSGGTDQKAGGEAATTWDYGIVTGSQPDRLAGSRQVLLQSEGSLGGEFRQLSASRIGADAYALFLVNYDPDTSKTNIEVRTVNAAQPDNPSSPQVAFSFPRKEYAIVLLDQAAGRWLMYHRSDEEPDAPIRVKTAPLRELQ